MRIRVAHTTRYLYDAPVRWMLQALRMTPQPHEGQHLVAWRLETDADVRLRAEHDVFGNIVHMLQVERAPHELAVQVEGEVETFDTAGVVRGAVERLPPRLYLRETGLTAAAPEIRAFAQDATREAGPDLLSRLHLLMIAIRREVAFAPGVTDTKTTAAQALALRRGVCQDMAHLFIAAARSLGAPARYVSGHLVRTDTEAQQAAHAWAEAHIPDLGWVAFDPANGVCATEGHLRVAIGLDYAASAPVRGAVYGGGTERLSVSLRVADAAKVRSQAQAQSQA
ncbi:MAG: transglutaminase family protein [Caulobacteraceae bacterium]|nr:transglutaminase family protein [Caulobacteraceae bacterium]